MNLKRALPGRRFLKFILSLALVWGILALVYIFIPTFEPKSTSVTDQLDQDQKIIRVYQTAEFFRRPPCPSPYPYPWEPTPPESRCKDTPPALQRFLNMWIQNVIFELKASTEDKTQYLTLGGGEDYFAKLPWETGTPPLTETRIPLNFEGLSLDGPAVVSEPFTVTVGYTNWGRAELIPRWFSIADSELISWWYGDSNAIPVPLRVMRDPKKGLLEVWPEHWDWKDFPVNQTTPADVRPLVSLKVPYVGGRVQFWNSLPPPPTSSSPTPYTLPARLILLLFLIPVAYIWYGIVIVVGGVPFLGVILFSSIISILINVLSFLFFVGLVWGVVWWFRTGRPPLSEIRERSGVGLVGQWGRQAETEAVGERVTYQYGFSINVTRTTTPSRQLVLEGPERDLEAAVHVEEQGEPSTSTSKQPATDQS